MKEFWGGKIPFVDEFEDLEEKDTVIQFGVIPNRIDLINSVKPLDFEDCWERRTEEELVFNGIKFKVYYIGIEDLIKNKRAVNRDKDSEDLKFLLKALERKNKLF